jgi:multimeric flavodoxin WrbA
MKVVAVLGSPRMDSNSAKLVEAVIQSLPATNLSVQKFVLNELKIRGCQGCFSCKGKTEFCVLKDELTLVLSACVETDLLILASPIYIGEVTAQMKIFIDRTFSWFKVDFGTNSIPGRLNPGKKLLFIVTQGESDKGTYQKKVIDPYLSYFKSQGFKAEAFVAGSLGLDDIKVTNSGLLDQVKGAIKKLI